MTDASRSPTPSGHGDEPGGVEDRLRDLEFQYVGCTPARHAWRFFSKASPSKLSMWLRHHSEGRGIISDSETRIRDSFDYLLGFYSLVEVACWTGVLPRALPKWFGEPAEHFLNNAAVRSYYETNYPLPVVQLLARRLWGEPANDPVPPDYELFERFRFLGAPMDLNDHEPERFLWLLDGGVVDGGTNGYDVDDFIAVMSNPRRLAQRLQRPPRRRDELDDAIAGFGVFLQFSCALDRLLLELESRELLQSVLWNHHGYWFAALSTFIGAQLPLLIREMSEWGLHDGPADGRVDRDIIPVETPSVSAVLSSLGRLSSGRYAWRVKELLSRPGRLHR